MSLYDYEKSIGAYSAVAPPLVGGMGMVYPCWHDQEGRSFALKTIRSEYISDESMRKRFQREGEVWVQLGRHPHVVHCHRVYRNGDDVYLVLDYVAKANGMRDASLRSWLTPDAPLPVEQALLFALQIVRGMVHATTAIAGLVHRDLKPENVLVGAVRMPYSSVNRVWVTDFGLAAVIRDASLQPIDVLSPGSQNARGLLGRTQTTHGVVGTPLYMAPERWAGEKADMRVDVYALGCILYEMVAGGLAFRGNDRSDLERAHTRGERAPLPDDVPEAVTRIVRRCLELDPTRRYHRWQDLEYAISGAYSSQTGTLVPPVDPETLLDTCEEESTHLANLEFGRMWLEGGKPQAAKPYFQKTLAYARAQGLPELTRQALDLLRRAHADHTRARADIERARAEAEESTCRENLEIGQTHLEAGEPHAAVPYFKEALAYAESRKQPGLWCQALNLLGRARAETDDWRRAERNFRRQLTAALEQDDVVEKILAERDLRIARSRIANQGKSSDSYLQELRTAHSTERAKRALARCRSAVAEYGRKGDQEGQLKALEEMREAAAQLGDLTALLACIRTWLRIRCAHR